MGVKIDFFFFSLTIMQVVASVTSSVTSICLIKIVWFFLDKLFMEKFCPLKKECPGGWASSEFTFWLTLFQSDMLLLFFNGKTCP